METPTTEVVCDCCALWIANNDESGCRDYYGHDHKRCDISYLWVLDGSEEEVTYHWTCYGCGTEMLPHSNQWPITYLNLN